MMVNRTTLLGVWAILVTFGCDDDGASADDGPDAAVMLETGEACPGAPAAPVAADINGDGQVNIGDAVALQAHLFRGGAAPACEAAADLNSDGFIELDDANRITSWLVAGTSAEPMIAEGACDGAMAPAAPACAEAGWGIQAPERVSEGAFTAYVTLGARGLSVVGWSLGVAAEGCRIDSVTTEGTAGGSIRDEPPGLRHLGYSASTTVEGGAISYTLLTTTGDEVLPEGVPNRVLRVNLSAEVPGDGCTPCVVRLVDGLSWTGQPVETLIAAGQSAWRAELSERSIEVCAP